MGEVPKHYPQPAGTRPPDVKKMDVYQGINLLHILQAFRSIGKTRNQLFGKPGAIRQAPEALLAVCTNRLENDNAFGPQSHGVGLSSAGCLNS